MACLCYWGMVFCLKEGITTMDFMHSPSLCPKVAMCLTQNCKILISCLVRFSAVRYSKFKGLMLKDDTLVLTPAKIMAEQ